MKFSNPKIREFCQSLVNKYGCLDTGIKEYLKEKEMTNKNTKDDMPVNIWLEGYSHRDCYGTAWGNYDYTYTRIIDGEYTNTEYIKKMIEGMRKFEGDESLALTSNIEYNQALDDVLKLLTP